MSGLRWRSTIQHRHFWTERLPSEHRTATCFEEHGEVFFAIVGLLVTFLIVLLSKVVILEAVDIVFGDDVEPRSPWPSAAVRRRCSRSQGGRGSDQRREVARPAA
jgi:hypothetical protein